MSCSTGRARLWPRRMFAAGRDDTSAAVSGSHPHQHLPRRRARQHPAPLPGAWATSSIAPSAANAGRCHDRLSGSVGLQDVPYFIRVAECFTVSASCHSSPLVQRVGNGVHRRGSRQFLAQRATSSNDERNRYVCRCSDGSCRRPVPLAVFRTFPPSGNRSWPGSATEPGWPRGDGSGPVVPQYGVAAAAGHSGQGCQFADCAGWWPATLADWSPSWPCDDFVNALTTSRVQAQAPFPMDGILFGVRLALINRPPKSRSMSAISGRECCHGQDFAFIGLSHGL